MGGTAQQNKAVHKSPVAANNSTLDEAAIKELKRLRYGAR